MEHSDFLRAENAGVPQQMSLVARFMVIGSVGCSAEGNSAVVWLFYLYAWRFCYVSFLVIVSAAALVHSLFPPRT